MIQEIYGTRKSYTIFFNSLLIYFPILVLNGEKTFVNKTVQTVPD